MTNIWQFLLQTAEVSLVAAILLLLKRIFQDKLSPRWQYGVWMLLVLRLAVPAGIHGRYISMHLAAAVEALKTMAESPLTSAYGGPYTQLSPDSVLPWISSAPESMTDWLFILYIAGILALLVRYAGGYFCLRMILRKGRPVSDGFRVRLDTLCERYGVRPCRCVLLSGISSAFVCGVFRPVLVIPSENIDEKILLHELLHLKYRDVAQGIFWCLVRCLHWCNPLMWYVTGRIACDMESLCDQRVLERLSGEERRDYGRILLSMTNEKYAGAPGTTSLSNGGRNISKRIRAIARFKKYPRGMALVSVCICILLAGPIFGSVSAMELPEQRLSAGPLGSQWSRAYDLAAARVHRCSTQAGAIDTYIKGVLYQDTAYLAAALPAEKQGKEMDEIRESSSGLIGEKVLMQHLTQLLGYDVYNLTNDEKREHHVQAVFHWVHDSVNIWDKAEETSVWSYVIFPLKLDWDGRSWTVEADGKPCYYETEDISGREGFFYDTDHQVFPELPFTHTWHGEGESGTVRIDEQVVQRIAQGEADNDPYTRLYTWEGLGGAGLPSEAYPDAEFTDRRLCRVVTFQSSWDAERRKAIRSVGMRTCILQELKDEPDLEDEMPGEGSSSANSDGVSFCGIAAGSSWDGSISDGFGVLYLDERDCSDYKGYAVRIFTYPHHVETIKVKRGESL